MTGSTSLLVRGIRWRLGSSILTVVISMIAVAAALLGPLYLRAAGDSVVHTSVDSSTIADRGVTLLGPPGQVIGLDAIHRAEATMENTGGRFRWYGPSITSVSSGVGLAAPDGSALASQLFYRDGICHLLVFRRGGCSGVSGDVVVSDRSATELGVAVGSVIDASVKGASAPLRLKVTGIYSVPDLSLAYWWGVGSGYFPFGQPEGPDRIQQVDPLITSAQTATAVPVEDNPSVIGQVPLISTRVNLGDEAGFERALGAAAGQATRYGVITSTRLPAILAAAAHQRHTMATIVSVAAIQLVILSIWVLAGLLLRSADSRRDEIRIARLRGFPAASLLWVAALEPVALCAAGIPLGVGLAWAAVRTARVQLLNPNAGTALDGWTAVALGLTTLAIAATVALGVWRLVHASDSYIPERRGDRGWRRSGLAADAVLLVLAVVAVVELTTSGALAGRTDPIASAAPALIGLGVAVIAVWLLLVLCRVGVTLTVYSTRVALFLALRQVVRRPGALRQARALVIATCLACFAVAAWSVGRANRWNVATFNVGSSEVATLSPAGVANFEEVVDRVDPTGRYAMAAETVVTPSSTLLAVDATRLARIAAWPRGISRSSAAAVSHALQPPEAPEVLVPSGVVEVTASTVASPDVPVGELQLSLWVSNPSAGTTIVNLGTLHRGPGLYGASVAGFCPGGCRLAGVAVTPAVGAQPPASGQIRLTVFGIESRTTASTAVPLAGDLFVGGWRSANSGARITFASSRAVVLTASMQAVTGYAGATGSASAPMAMPADHPDVLPAVVTADDEASNGGASAPGGIPVEGLDGNTLNVDPVVTALAVPQLGADAAIVDLDLLARAQVDPTSPYTVDQVWLGPSAPPTLIDRLQAAGLRVQSIQRASALDSQYERTGPALADAFFLIATIASLLVAAVSTLGVVGTTFRHRATEIAALEIVGVRPRVLGRSLLIESVVLAATALFGAAAGLIASALAIRSLPGLASPAPIPLQYRPSDGPLAFVILGAFVVILLAALAAAAVVLRDTSPSLLRSAPSSTEA
jgi:hypothetical protein